MKKLVVIDVQRDFAPGMSKLFELLANTKSVFRPEPHILEYPRHCLKA